MGRRGQMGIVFACEFENSNIPGSSPGPACTFAPSEINRDPYTLYACRLQWATIRCGKHVHAGYMSF